MGIIDRLLNRKAANNVQAIPMVETMGSGFFTREDNKGGLDEYKGWTYACVRAIAENVAGIELELKHKDGDETETLTEHDVLTFLNDANPFMTFFDVVNTTQSFLELEGSAFWWVAREGANGKGKPVSIWPLRPDFITVVPDEANFVKEYKYKVGNKTYTLSVDNVIPFKEFNPKDPFKGLGTTYAAASSINADNYARAWQGAFFKNGARIDGVITKDGDMSEEEYKTINNRWNDKYKGAEKAHKTAILSNGLKYQAIGATPTDMDFVNLRTMSRDEILAMFRVPKTMLGVTDGTQTRATAETSEYVFSKNTIKPKMQKFVRTLNEYLLPMFGLSTTTDFLSFKDPVPENRELILATYTNGLAGGWLAINEVRAREALTPVAGGDDVRVGFGTEALGAPIETPKKIANSKPTSKSKEVSSIAKELAMAIAPAFKAVADMETFEKDGLVAHKAQIKRGDKYIPKLAKIMDGYFDDAKERVLSAYDDAYKKNVKATKAAADDLFDEDEEAKTIVGLVKKFFNVVVQNEGNAALLLAGFNETFDARADRVQEGLDASMEKLAEEVSEETAKKIKQAIEDGFENGEDITAIRKRIEELTAFDKARSETIARTEVVRTQNFASVEAWKDSGLVEKKVWYTAEDERVDDECAALHGEEYDLDGVISDGDGYGPVEAPPLHPNCRCTLLPVVTPSKAVSGEEMKSSDILRDLAELEAIDNELDTL